MDLLSAGRRAIRLAAALALVPAALHAQAAARSSVRSSRTPVELPRTYVGGPTRAPISAADLMTRLYAYADDSMMGRDAASEYNRKATDYIAREVQRLGLEPAGEDGYFQYPLVRRATDPTLSALTVDGTAYALWRAFAPRDQGNGMRAFDGAQAVYGGSLGDTARLIPREAAAGRVVVLTLARDSAGRRDYDNVNRAQLLARFPDAAAIAVLQLDHVPPGYVERFYASPQLGVRGQAGDRPFPSYFYVTDAAGRALLGVDPETAAPGAAGRVVHGRVAFAETQGPGRNVVAVLRGSDPVLRDEYVAIGAHNDHVGFFEPGTRFVDHDSVRLANRLLRRQGVETPARAATPEEARMLRAAIDSAHARHGGPRADSIFNGADDDGSGTVSVLEIAEQLASLPARQRPRRSILFVWHVGEEYGMLGSGFFTANPTVARGAIVAQLNIDMIGRGGDDDITGVTKEGVEISGGAGYVQLIGSRRLSTELGDMVERVNTERRLGLRFDYALDANAHPQNIYCRSDHASYARWGIPVVFFTTGGHSDYHQVSDEPQYIDYARMERIATLVAALATRVGNLDHRVVVDGPRPDPTGACRQ